MAVDSTLNMQNAMNQISKTPNLVLEIDGFEQVYGIVTIRKFVRWGDVGLEFGNFIYGGFNDVENQSSYISLNDGTTTSIRQNLNIDVGKGESISSMQIALIDKNGELTRDFAPGAVVPDILGRRAKIWMGEQNVAWKDDYFVLFKGRIDEVRSNAGVFIINIAHPDKDKQSEIFPIFTTELSSDLAAGDTVINVNDASQFLVPINGPDLTIDQDLEFMIKINDELIKYENTTGNQFQNITRGQLNTVVPALPDVHKSGDTVEGYYRLKGNVIDIALKLMLSGHNGAFIENVVPTNFVKTGATEQIANSIFFDTIDVAKEFGITIGDYITTTLSGEASNNVTLKRITAIENNAEGSYIIIDGVSFTLETNTTALLSFRSKYDVYPDQIGLKMIPDDVDVKSHEELRNQFLSPINYDFYIKAPIEGKVFITEELYNPAGAFSIPKAKSSLGYHSPPIPTTKIKDVDINNVLNADKIGFRRTTSKSFYNHIAYKYDEQVLTEDLKTVVIVRSQDSIDRIEVGNNILTIESKGLRNTLGADTQVLITASRRLNKYKFAASRIEDIKVQLKDAYEIEIGDLVLLDLTSLKMSNNDTGTRTGDPKLFNVINRVIDYKTGSVSLKLEDSGFNADARFGLISPSSFVKSQTALNKVIVKPSFSRLYGDNEYRKYQDLIGVNVIIRSQDYSIVESNIIAKSDSNEIEFQNNFTISILEDYIMEFDIYSTQPAKIKLIYAFMNDTDFPDGDGQYLML